MLSACRLAFLFSICIARRAKNDDRTFNLGTLGGLIGTGVGAAGGAPLGAATGGLAGAALSNALLNNPYIGGLFGGGTGAVVGGATGAGIRDFYAYPTCFIICIFSYWSRCRQFIGEWYTGIGDRRRRKGWQEWQEWRKGRKRR